MNTKLLILLFVLIGFAGLTVTSITPALSSIALGLKTDIHLVESALGVFFAGFALGVCFWGIIADKRGRRFSMLSGLFIYCLATFLCAFSTTILQYWILNFIQAFAIATCSVITLTVFRDLCEEKERAHIFSIVSIAIAFSPAIGPLLGTWINAQYDWQTIYFALTLASFIMLIVSLFFFPETRKTQDNASSQLLPLVRIMLKDRLVLGTSALIGICNASLFCFFAEAPFIFVENLGISLDYYAWIGCTASIAFLLAGVVGRKRLLRCAPETIIHQGATLLVLGALSYAISTAIVSFFELTGLIPTAVFVACLFILFFGVGLIIPNCLSIALKAYSNQVGSAGSIFGCAYYVVISLITAAMSLLHNGTMYPLPFYLASICISAFIIAQKTVPIAAIGEQV